MIEVFYWKWGFWIWIGKHWISISYQPDWSPLYSYRQGFTYYKKVCGVIIKYRKQEKDDD